MKILKKLLKPDRIEGDVWIFESEESKARVRFFVSILFTLLWVSLTLSIIFLIKTVLAN